MSSNVLPSAPELYPQPHSELNHKLQPDFRMQKVSEISASLNKEVNHYRSVAKKYKRAKKVAELECHRLKCSFSCVSQVRVLALLFLLSVCRLQYLLVVLVVAFALTCSGLITASQKA